MIKKYTDKFGQSSDNDEIFAEMRRRELGGENVLEMIDEYFESGRRRSMTIMYGLFIGGRG
jgi:hypothetical protein